MRIQHQLSNFKNKINSFTFGDKDNKEFDKKSDQSTIFSHDTFTDSVSFSDSDYDNDLNTKVTTMEGFLYKITKKGKVKKLWFKLMNRDFFCKISLII